MSLFLTCEDTTSLLSDYVDGNLSFWQTLKVKLHLLFCPSCQAVVLTLMALPALAAGLEEAPPAEAEAALEAALASISRHGETRAWPATPVPAEAENLLGTQPDLPLAILADAHQTVARGRRPEPGPYHLPRKILDRLPPEDQWNWVEGADGRRRVVLLQDPGAGQRLILAFSPSGARAKAHRHLGSESILILAGSMSDKGLALKPGDWVHHPTGSVHAPEIREQDCWCLVREEGGTRDATMLERLKLRFS